MRKRRGRPLCSFKRLYKRKVKRKVKVKVTREREGALALK